MPRTDRTDKLRAEMVNNTLASVMEARFGWEKGAQIAEGRIADSCVFLNFAGGAEHLLNAGLLPNSSAVFFACSRYRVRCRAGSFFSLFLFVRVVVCAVRSSLTVLTSC